MKIPLVPVSVAGRHGRSSRCLTSCWEGEGFLLPLLPKIRPFLVTTAAAAVTALLSKNKHPVKKKATVN